MTAFELIYGGWRSRVVRFPLSPTPNLVLPRFLGPEVPRTRVRGNPCAKQSYPPNSSPPTKDVMLRKDLTESGHSRHSLLQINPDRHQCAK